MEQKSTKKVVAFKDDEFTVHLFLRACDQNDIDVVQKYIRRGMDPNCHEEDFRTGLYIAADNNYLKLLKLLLSNRNVKINAQNDWGVTALYQACVRNNLQAVLILLEFNADVNIGNKHDMTPLHCAVLNGYRELVKILLKRGAKVNCANIFGKTPLYIAVLENPSEEISEILVNYGADVDTNNGITMPILHEGALSCQSRPQLDVLSHFVSLGCDVNIKDKLMGRTAMHIVAITNYVPLAEFLISKGAKLGIKDYVGKTPLYIAERLFNTAMVEFLQYMEIVDQNENSLLEYSDT